MNTITNLNHPLEWEEAVLASRAFEAPRAGKYIDLDEEEFISYIQDYEREIRFALKKVDEYKENSLSKSIIELFYAQLLSKRREVLLDHFYKKFGL